MRVCSYCAHQVRPGTIFCDQCGRDLLGDTTTPLRPIDLTIGGVHPGSSWGTARLERESTVAIYIHDAEDGIFFQPNGETILGRSDSAGYNSPDIDLNPYGGLEKGVSRQHATIARMDDTLTITDMGSRNGTLLNGESLPPDQPWILHDGDEICLGKLILHIYFK